MPTIRATFRAMDEEGKIMTKRYANAQAHVHPTTQVLYLSRREGTEEDILAAFHPETSLYGE
jgi:hypothetical protein